MGRLTQVRYNHTSDLLDDSSVARPMLDQVKKVLHRELASRPNKCVVLRCARCAVRSPTPRSAAHLIHSCFSKRSSSPLVRLASASSDATQSSSLPRNLSLDSLPGSVLAAKMGVSAAVEAASRTPPRNMVTDHEALVDKVAPTRTGEGVPLRVLGRAHGFAAYVALRKLT